MRPRLFGWGPGGSDGAQLIRMGYELVLMGPSGFGSARVDSGGAHWGCWHKGPMQCPFFSNHKSQLHGSAAAAAPTVQADREVKVITTEHSQNLAPPQSAGRS